MRLQGNPVSSGIGVAPVLFYFPVIPQVEKREISQEKIPKERERVREICRVLSSELRRFELHEEAEGRTNIFEAHAELLSDPAVLETIYQLIDTGACAEWSVSTALDGLAEMMRDSGNVLMAERAADFEDLRREILRRLMGVRSIDLAQLKGPCILVAEELLPSEIAQLPVGAVSGVVTRRGGATSHASILARSRGIPMLAGVTRYLSNMRQGETVIVDALEGVLIVDPEPDEILRYRSQQRRWVAQREQAAYFRYQQAMTEDGERVSVMLNVGGEIPEPREVEACDGIGLLRSEFLFLGIGHPPGEEEQFVHYRGVLEACAGKPVTLRTADLGGEKRVPYLQQPKEENPELGLRGTRLGLAFPQLLKTQLRAAYRASVYGSLRLLFPMVGSLEEWREVLNIVEEVKRELTHQGIPICPQVPLGVMIEIPALALMGDQLAQEVDFANIGTNDLCQYITAADRGNAAVGKYLDHCHPALWKLLYQLSVSFQQQHKPLCICGELAGNPRFLLGAYGLGIKSFSMELSAVGQVKSVLSASRGDRLRQLAAALPFQYERDDVQAILMSLSQE